MTATLQNAKDPAEAATSHRVSSIPLENRKMNRTEDNTGRPLVPALSRRGFLGAAAVASLPVAAAAAPGPVVISIDASLAKALPSERVAYHSNALAEALAEMRPDRKDGWHVMIDHDHPLVMVTPNLVRRGQGSTVLADREASR